MVPDSLGAGAIWMGIMTVKKLVVFGLECANIRTGTCGNTAEFRGETEKEARFNVEYANWTFRRINGQLDCLCPTCHSVTSCN